MTGDVEALEAALLDDLPTLAALRAGFRAGLLRQLRRDGMLRRDALPTGGAAVILRLLEGVGAVEPVASGWRLSAGMQTLLDRDEAGLRARAEFVALAGADLLRFGDLLALDRNAFTAAADTFRFFQYTRAKGIGASNLEDTAPWVAYVTALSEREAPDLAPLVPLEGCRHLLEIGGNTGVMALALLERHALLKATVLDLPAVCRLGEVRSRGRAGAERLRFRPGDARAGGWPEADAVLFKSVLHDWTAERAQEMLAQAARHVPAGGRVIVCERGAIVDEPAMSGAQAAANLVFAPFYRSPSTYEDWLGALGLRVLRTATLRLDMTFYVVAGERTA